MQLSKLRLRLSAAFALAYALGLTALVAVMLGYLWRESVRRLDARLNSIATGAASALEREMLETPDAALALAASETVAEWPVNDESFAILDEHGALVVAADRAKAIDSAMNAVRRGLIDRNFTFGNNGQKFHGVVLPVATIAAKHRAWRYRIMAYHSTEGIARDVELLVGVVAIAAPLIVLLSLVGGYLLARRALAPMNDLRGAIAGVAPANLEQRLPVAEPRDEIGLLAAEFNALLDRLADAQRQNRRFIRAAAHQIRTPLTLVLGEAGYELSAETSSEESLRSALARVRAAAEQMTSRVDELFLLAEAQAGEEVKLRDEIELDGLVLDCAVMMRARAAALGKTLAIGTASPQHITGNATLLREALLELIENGCKHGLPAVPITISADVHNDHAIVSVESAGPPFALPTKEVSSASGMGLTIVQWIASGHHGEVRVASHDGRNVVSLHLPLTAG